MRTTAFILIIILADAFTAHAQTATPAAKPLVLIGGDGNTTVNAVAVGPVATATASKHNQTIEMADRLIRYCPDIALTVNMKDEKYDYILALDAISGGFVLQSTYAQVILLRSDKSVMSTFKGSLSKTLKESCKAITSDWNKRVTAKDARTQ